MNTLYTYNFKQNNIKNEITKTMITNNIQFNEIDDYDWFNYSNSYIYWFDEETIIIAFIDKLVQLDYNKYKRIITDLFDKLIIKLKYRHKSLTITNEYILNSYNNSGCGYIFCIDYIEYLLTNTDLTKLIPTQKYGFMYLTYNYLYYELCLMDYLNNFLIDDIKLSYIIDNNIFNDDIFNLLYDNLTEPDNSISS